jgi:hypothetical protein
MRVREVRISGFKAIPVCAAIQHEGGEESTNKGVIQIRWQRDSFHMTLPVVAGEKTAMLGAIIGANSAGKSSILLALSYLFSNTSKLDSSLFHGKSQEQPVVVELRLVGKITAPEAWHMANCVQRGAEFELTVAHVWNVDGRTRYILRQNGKYHKQNSADRAQCEKLLPEFRIIWADGKLADAADLEKRNLAHDLIDHLLAQDSGPNSIVAQMEALVGALGQLLERSAPSAVSDWAAIEALEASLSQGLASITPQRSRVRLQLKEHLPTVRQLFHKGVMQIDDGVTLEFNQHGLGLQRSFVVSVLRTWCDYVRDAERDYLFAIEEPEIYLHPHATRVLLNTLELVAKENQVLFTTHASEFVNRVPLHHVLTVRRHEVDGNLASQARHPDLRGLSPDEAGKVQRYLREDRSDMLFARAVLLVEGQAELFAMPNFARTLGLDLDGHGVSVVFVNGIGNFPTYHQILEAFQIPHVILVDGDGRAAERRRLYGLLANRVVVLEQDFEQLLADALPSDTILGIINECLIRRGKPTRKAPGPRAAWGKELVSLGKPLVGRVVGEQLTRREIELMPSLVEALSATVELAVKAAEPMRSGCRS